MEATTIRISELSVAEIIDDEMHNIHCEQTIKEVQDIPGSQPLDWKAFLDGTDLAVHAADLWLDSQVERIGTRIPIDMFKKFVEIVVDECMDRAQWMVLIQRGGN